MTTWITSDLHINHLNILKYCPHRVHSKHDGVSDYTWDDVSAMNELIISNWNSVVQPDDEVWILGDVCMGQIFKAPAYISRLSGRKHLIKGNHDKTLVKHVREGETVPAVKDLFESVHDYWELTYPYNGKKHMIVMSHYPLASWNGMNQGTLHTHGHLHGAKSHVTGRIKDVGMDVNNLFPYKLDDVVKELLTIDVIRDHHNKPL